MRTAARRLGALALLLSLLLAACDADDGTVTVIGGNGSPSPTATGTGTATATASPTATGTPTPSTQPGVSPAPGSLSLVAAFDGRDFDRPVELGVYPAGPEPGSRLFVAEQTGMVLLFGPEGESVLLNIRSQVSTEGNEEGLLSVAVDPVFTETGHLWVYYSVAGGPRRTRLSRFTVDLPSDPFSADPASELVILEVPQPFRNHNGGAIRFGPDLMLYLGLGDGGGGGDPQGNGQNLETLLGSVIRIDVRDASAAQPYAIPPDNPFVGVPGAREEIWAYGLRNPWRMAFDRDGALWLGDVGQNEIEEIDVIERGGNYGWNRLEGTRCFEPSSGCDRSGVTLPVAEYDHGLGCSVTGGVVYRGDEIPLLEGFYVFADLCSGRVWALPPNGDPAVEVARSSRDVVSFGTDVRGEVYLISFGGPIQRLAP